MKRTVLGVFALLSTACPVAADGGSSRLDVDYRPPRLSVEASGLTLAQILSAIAAKVGFTVVDSGAPSGPVTVSIHDASVEDVLRQLLRGTNHSVLYLGESAPGSTPIDKVVLLGTPGVAQPSSTTPVRQQSTATVATSVGDLLRVHAQSATQIAAPTPDNAQRPAAPVGNLDASLAETTRRAQQDLAALVKGLAAATRGLHDSLVADPK